MKKYLKIFVVSSLIVLALYEGGIGFLLCNPNVLKHFPQAILWHVRNIYLGADRTILQLLPQAIQYDDELTYVLSPKKFIFSNREFSTVFSVNSKGLRDDEASLERPEIIVLGDSVAMGWGVEQEATFAQIIEKATGHKVLNAAIASYATVRELKMLNRLDTRNLKYLIIQYAGNDLEENSVFFEKGTLPIKDRVALEKIIKEYSKGLPYYFGKYTFCTLARWFGFIKQILSSKDKAQSINSDAAELFLNALLKIPAADFNRVQIIVLAVNDYLQDSRPFIESLENKKQSLKYPDFIQNLITTNLSSGFEAEDGFILDDHPNAKGHAVIAREILHLIDPKEY